MNTIPIYSRTERLWLSILALVSLVGLNGAFLYGVFLQPGVLRAALSNPIAIAFMLEAFLLVAALAWLLVRWRASRIGWAWFVVLSLVGGLAFALPVALLWKAEERHPPGQ